MTASCAARRPAVLTWNGSTGDGGPGAGAVTRDDSWIDRFPQLAALPAEPRHKLRAQARIVDLPSGARVFGPGHPPQSFLLLLSGSVRVQQTSENGREIVLYRVAPGESCTLTTACLVGHEAYQAEGIAETQVRAVAIPRGLFDELLASSRTFRDFVFEAFGRRVTELLRLIEDVAFARLDVRLAERLLQLAAAADHIDATHQQLANELGSAREVISRQLNDMQRRGWVRVTRGAVEIVDRAALERLAREG